MPCLKCKTILLYSDDKWQCPSCNNLIIIKTNDGIKYIKRLIRLTRHLFQDYLTELNKTNLILEIAWAREMYSSETLVSGMYELVDLGRLFNYSFLLREASKFCRKNGKSSTIDLNKVFKMGEAIIKIVDIESKVESEYYTIVLKKSIDYNNFTLDEWNKYGSIHENENYHILYKKYTDNRIFNKRDSKKVFYQLRESFGKFNGQYKDYNSQEFIESCFEIINSLYGGLLRSNFYSDVFDLRHFKEVFHDPSDLMKLVWSFQRQSDVLTLCSKDEFVKKARQILGTDEKNIQENLLYSENNTNIFPLFILINSKPRDQIVISHRFAYYIYTILHRIITDTLFYNEVNKRSKNFEIDVKREFERLGYLYSSNIITTDLEIDGIAVKNGQCFVIECKSLSFSMLIDENRKKNQIIRDLRGYIDGIKYTTRNGTLKPEKIPSLLDKVTYVYDNLSKLKISNVNKINGLLVTPDYPFISKYQEIQIISFKQISELM